MKTQTRFLLVLFSNILPWAMMRFLIYLKTPAKILRKPTERLLRRYT